MWYYKEDLTDRLSRHSQSELIRFIVTLYNKNIPEVVGAVNQFVVTDTETSLVFSQLKRYTAGECKAALAAEIKRTRDKGRRVEIYLDLIEKILDDADKLDHRYLGLASATFGKAMTILGNNVDLWDIYDERARAIASRFGEMRGAQAWKAVEYYQNGREEHDIRVAPKA